MLDLFHTFIYEPLYNTLIFLYNVIPGHDFGVAIILTTLALKTLLVPLSHQQIASQKKLQELQPKMKALQEKHKDDKERQTKALMEFYKEEKVNPLSGCLPLIVQIIFLIAIYHVIINISKAGFIVNTADLYLFVQNPGPINHFFLRFIDLTKPNYVLAFLSAIGQYYQTKMILGRQVTPPLSTNSDQPDFTAIMNKQMLYLAPGLTFFIGATFPAALSLYWLFSTLFMIVQQKYIFRVKK
ncbi:MAG: YidC/Oxa1 family membrane protein insertase [Patescibacteria group bacterium]